jgi:hypothetical protein
VVLRTERWKGFNLHRIESWACIVTKIEEEEDDDDDDYGDEDE